MKTSLKGTEGLWGFYFRSGQNSAVNISVCLFFSIFGALMVALSCRNAYWLLSDGENTFFLYIVWLFLFALLWDISIKIYPNIWDEPAFTLARKSIYSVILLFVYSLSLIGFLLTDNFINQLPADLTLEDLFNFMTKLYVMCIFGGLFILTYKVKRYGVASLLWGIAGFNYVFSLLPERSGDLLDSLVRLPDAKGEQWSFLTFLVAVVIVLFGFIYVGYFKKFIQNG